MAMGSRTAKHDPALASPPARPMSADEVLEVMVDVWRQREGIDPNTRYVIPITGRTNVARAADLMGVPSSGRNWIDLATTFQSLFRVEIERERWRAVLEPTKHKSLGPVCDLIAERALAPVMERRFDSTTLDWPAAAFRSMLLILNDAGIDVHELTPRSKLATLLPTSSRAFTELVTRLAPGRMPALRSINHSFRASIAALAAGAMAHIAARAVPVTFLPALGSVLLLVGAIGILLSSTLPARRYRLGNLETFDDLAHALTSPPPQTPDPPLPTAEEAVRWGSDCHPSYAGLR
jgi:hypothetical protein